MTDFSDLKIELDCKLVCGICDAQVSWGDVRVDGDCPNCGVEWNETATAESMDPPVVYLNKI